MKRFLHNHPHFYALLFLIPPLIWFKILEMTTIPKYYTQTAWDAAIPFIKIFVVPYLLWFAYIAFGLIYTGLHEKTEFYRLLLFLIGGMTVAYAAYMIFPNAQQLRPVITGHDILSDMIRFVYQTDTPTNVCPSVHVINSIAIAAALSHSRSFRSIKLGNAVSLLLAVLICLSTVFIKQHAVIDVFCGLMVGAVFYLILYTLPVVASRRKLSKKTATVAEEENRNHGVEHVYP